MTEHPLPPPPARSPKPADPPWRSPFAVGAAIVVFVRWSAFMVAVGAATYPAPTATTEMAKAASPAPTYASPVPTTTTTTPPTTQAPAPTTTAPAAIKDGTYRVGVDIEPGTYRSTSTASCYWARLRDFTGTGNDVIANEFVMSGLAVVTIQPGDVGFKSQKCGRWERIG